MLYVSIWYVSIRPVVMTVKKELYHFYMFRQLLRHPQEALHQNLNISKNNKLQNNSCCTTILLQLMLKMWFS